ncbi:BadM/Rrf2 family transcriptional regulator [Alsobacter soli]|uniref:BadM/Rrf2 family transcriptional regulator n=1 Tax=Alsobacter soli TaxID=2109933 RepID=A0A2T1HVW8_9HYPH|nr:Rrf2 family transcriptional regulator [Alsobacter soli]PSC05804.1 BadM/Rrf2 family transcriptional regulator [Alsobacter soli]
MKLTAHTDFGIRILMSLAAAPETRLTIDDLARRHRLSEDHLRKVAQSLVRAGFAEGVRGRGGGLRLAREPADIRLGKVVRALEEDLALVACLGDQHATCIFTGACRLTGALGRALAAFLEELDGVTLADLVAPRQPIRARLGLAG